MFFLFPVSPPDPGPLSQAETVAEGERRQQAELLQLRRDHVILEEAHRRAIINLAEAREKLAMSEVNVSRLQALSVKAASADGGAVSQLHALRSRVAGKKACGEGMDAL